MVTAVIPDEQSCERILPWRSGQISPPHSPPPPFSQVMLHIPYQDQGVLC